MARAFDLAGITDTAGAPFLRVSCEEPALGGAEGAGIENAGASRAHDNSCDQLLMRTETSNMKPNEPSRTALIIVRQRAAHQVLDHGSILYDPICHEDSA